MDKKHEGVTVRGNRIQIAFTYNGKRCRETLRNIVPTKENLLYAARKRGAILLEVEKGIFEYLEHFPSSKTAMAASSKKGCHTTIEEALKEWLRSCEKRCEHSTVRDYTSSIYFHLIPNFGQLHLDELQRSHVERWINSVKISAKRINNTLIPLRQVFKKAFEDEIIDKNPMNRVKNLRVNTREPKPFNLEEIGKILSVLDGQNRNLIQFAFWSGLRTSELIALSWENVDFANNRIYVRQAIVRGKLKGPKTKAGDRHVELQSDAKLALQAQQQFSDQTGYVFLNQRTGQRWKSDQPIRKTVWIPALLKAGIEYREPYQTRHTFASMLLSAGKNPMWVSLQMGHRDWGMIIKTYGRWINEG
jgi:integrase